jgi:hypothetical protein
MQGWFNVCKSINVIQYTNRIMNKNQVIILIDAGKAFDKIQHLFMINSLKKLGIERLYLNIIREIYNKAVDNIVHNGKKRKHFL